MLCFTRVPHFGLSFLFVFVLIYVRSGDSMMLPSPGGDVPSALPSIARRSDVGDSDSKGGFLIPVNQDQLQGERPASQGSSQGDGAHDSLGALQPM